MPVKNSKYITTEVFFLKESGEDVFSIYIKGCLLTLTIEAGELLVGYLRLIKAYFTSFRYHHKIMNGYYDRIAKQLIQHQETIQLKEISLLIERFGCICDWEYEYRNTSA